MIFFIRPTSTLFPPSPPPPKKGKEKKKSPKNSLEKNRSFFYYSSSPLQPCNPISPSSLFFKKPFPLQRFFYPSRVSSDIVFFSPFFGLQTRPLPSPSLSKDSFCRWKLWRLLVSPCFFPPPPALSFSPFPSPKKTQGKKKKKNALSLSPSLSIPPSLPTDWAAK